MVEAISKHDPLVDKQLGRFRIRCNWKPMISQILQPRGYLACYGNQLGVIFGTRYCGEK
jgi:hypothetical protein